MEIEEANLFFKAFENLVIKFNKKIEEVTIEDILKEMEKFGTAS